jgi:hypothetical protein
MRSLYALLGVCALSCAQADEYALDIRTDTGSAYFVVEKSGNPEQPVLVVKRVRAGATSYSKRMFDCDAGTTRSLGSSENLKDLTNACHEGDMIPVTEDTVVYQLWKHACGK